MAKLRSLAALGIAAATLSSCSFAPPYRPPAVTAPPAFKEAGAWQTAVPAAAQASAWWRVLGDPVLDGLEARLAADNPTLAGALGRYDQAQGYLQQARAGLFPTVGVNANITDNRQSDHRPLRSANQPTYYPADTVGGSLGFELDLWGRVRNSVRAGRALADASGDDAAALKLSLQGQLATTYLLLRGYDQQLAWPKAATVASSRRNCWS